MEKSGARLVALAGMALVVAACVLLLSWPRRHPPRRGGASGGSLTGVPVVPSTPATSSPPATGHPGGVTTSDREHHPARAHPERPRFSELTEASQKQMQSYLFELWLYCADDVRQQLDGVCASQGADAGLDYLQGFLSSGSYAPMPVEEKQRPLLTAGSATLSSFDYEKWFRSLLALRLVPYAATRDPSPELLRRATGFLLDVARKGKDPFTGLMAAFAFSDDERSVMPDFGLAGSETVGGPPVGLDFGFYSTSSSYYTTPGFNETRDTLHQLQLSLAPMLKDSPWATQEMAQAIEQCGDDRTRQRLLKDIVSMPESQRYVNTYVDLAANPKIPFQVRNAAFGAIQGGADSQQLRDAVDAALSSNDTDLRNMVIEHVQHMFPQDHGYGDRLQGFVRNDSEDPEVRCNSADALVAFYAGRMPTPEYRTTVETYLTEMVHAGDWSHFDEVSQTIVKHQATDFVGVYRSLLSSVESSETPRRPLPEEKQSLRTWIKLIEDSGDDR